MKNKFAKILYALTAVVISCALLFACAPNENPWGLSECENITTEGRVLSSGEQTLTVKSITPTGNGNKARFKSGIDISDVTVSGALYGKTLMAVIYEDESTIKLLFSGETYDFEGVSGQTQIRISKNALYNGYDSICTFEVYKSQVLAKESIFDVTGCSIQTKFVLPWGSFTDKATTDAVSLFDSTVGKVSEVTVADEGRALIVTVSNFYGTLSQMPTIIIASDATTFGVVITIGMETGSTFRLN